MTSFLSSLFRECHPNDTIEIRDVPNSDGYVTTRRLLAGNPDVRDIPPHGDRASRYFGVSTRKSGTTRGRREDLAECPALWADIDTLKSGVSPDKAGRALRSLPHPPTVVVDTGGGMHAYWVLVEPANVSDETTGNQVVGLLRALCRVIDGDPAVCDLARVLRLPGSVNAKPAVVNARGGPHLVRVSAVLGHRHDIDELADWLSWQRPVIAVPDANKQGELNIGAHNLPGGCKTTARYAGLTPFDPADALRTMEWRGTGDRAVHTTQLRVSASLARIKLPEDVIVAALMEATRGAAGDDGAKWNWAKEEEGIRKMTNSAREKFGREEEKK